MKFPLAESVGEGALGLSPPDLIGEDLYRDASRLYSELRDIRHADIGELWRLARDLVQAIDHWSAAWTDTPGAERMEIALDAAWRFVQAHGGASALREVLARYVDARLPGPLGPLTGWIIRRLLSDGTLRHVLQLVIELAVRETHASTQAAA